MGELSGSGIVTAVGAACARVVIPLKAPPIIAAAIAMDAASFVLYDHVMGVPLSS
jgi:hypothetical protein